VRLCTGEVGKVGMCETRIYKKSKRDGEKDHRQTSELWED
jgi:hypothetical protein